MLDHDTLRVLVVDEDPAALEFMSVILKSAGHGVLTARNGADALQIVLDTGPQIVITGWNMPKMNGGDLCRAIRSNRYCGFIYIIMVTAHASADLITAAFQAGVDDFAAKPIEERELLARLHAARRIIDLKGDLDKRNRELHRVNAEMAITTDKLAEANEKLHQLATTDELTGLMNRREALERLDEHWALACRHDRALSAVMMDIDHFKKVNDLWGHDAGDKALQTIAAALQRSVRVGETVARLGGEEFLVICPGASELQAARAAERWRIAVESACIAYGGHSFGVTISLGVAERRAEVESPEDLLRAADEALYHSKRTGRNRVSQASCTTYSESRATEGSLTERTKTQLDPLGSDGSRAPVKLLIIDGDDETRAARMQALKLQGYEVSGAADATSARDRVSREAPDLIVMVRRGDDVFGEACLRGGALSTETKSIPVIAIGAGSALMAVSNRSLQEDAVAWADAEASALDALLRPCRQGPAVALGADAQMSEEADEEKARVMGFLAGLASSLITADNLQAALEKIVLAAAELTRCRQVAILLPSQDQKVLTLAHSIGIDEEEAAQVRVPLVLSDDGSWMPYREKLVVNTKAQLLEHGELLGADVFRQVPLVSAVLSANRKQIGVLNITGRSASRVFTAFDLECIDLLCNLSAGAIESYQKREASNGARDAVVIALATLAEYRDDGTGKHLERVTEYCTMLAEGLRERPEFSAVITDRFIQDLRRAVPLHDIGNIAIPDHILLKPGKLTTKEMEVMERHASIGAATIRSVMEKGAPISFLEMAEIIAHCHHEWYNGEGYPRGLKGVEIPIEARIAAVADVYDALTTERVYKHAVPHEEACEIIVQGTGSQFDPVVVDAFIRKTEQFMRCSRELSDEASGSGKLGCVSPTEYVELAMPGFE
jgi:diguanylate cyclase (GGDEF)-like protein